MYHKTLIYVAIKNCLAIDVKKLSLKIMKKF